MGVAGRSDSGVSSALFWGSSWDWGRRGGGGSWFSLMSVEPTHGTCFLEKKVNIT